MIYHRMGYLTT